MAASKSETSEAYVGTLKHGTNVSELACKSGQDCSYKLSNRDVV